MCSSDLGRVCPKSEDGYHHANSYQFDRGNGYYTCICSYCGHEFEAYESDLQQSYQQQVDSLPAPGYNSAGRLVWQPSFSDIDFNNCGVSVTGSFNGFSSLPYSNIFVDLSFDSIENALKLVATPSSSASSYTAACVQLSFVLPIDGSYCLTDSLRASVRAVGTDGVFSECSYSYEFGSFRHYSKGNCFILDRNHLSYGLSGSYSTAVSYWYFPVFQVIPDTALDTTPTGPYGINSRPTTITGGNLGIVGDNGQITTINNNQQIINETNNTYYNPATGQTSTITDWSYNYDGRIYTITLDTGDTVNVEYGDENITITENTINEGDTIVNNYTIYYIIDGGGENPGPGPSGSPDPGPTVSVCPHIWKEVNRTEPGCTSPGTAQYICSQCGETKAETLKATGHTWQVLRTVQTAYDDEGNMIQQGYTIYQCAVCSEQYKDDQGTGPPGGGGSTGEDKETIWDKIANFFGSIVDGIAGIFEAILGKLLDALTALSEMLMGKVKDVVEVVLSVLDEVPKLFDGFLNFLGVVFPFIPAEITLLLTFGVIAVVFIGIIKAIRR